MFNVLIRAGVMAGAEVDVADEASAPSRLEPHTIHTHTHRGEVWGELRQAE